MTELLDTSLTVSELTQQIKGTLETRYKNLTVRGEISNFKLHTSGHLYFSLKDAAAQISAVMFRPEAARLKSLPKDGDQVSVQGDLNLYPPRGSYQIVCREMNKLGLGELLEKLELLKRELLKKGYFAKERKRTLPPFPKRVGLITSPTGAAIQDILRILKRRHAGIEVIVNPVHVQGKEAAGEIAQAIRQMNQYQLCDVIICGRGGGSIEDLWAFNEEIVADAIFESHIPIISAVGHETDHCIADYVADVRAPTPSAAAELVSAEREKLVIALERARSTISATLTQRLREARGSFKRLIQHPLLATSYLLLGKRMQAFDEVQTAIDRRIAERIREPSVRLSRLESAARLLRPDVRLTLLTKELHSLTERLNFAIRKTMSDKSNRLQAKAKERRLDSEMRVALESKRQALLHLAEQLHLLDPREVLRKGYSILTQRGRVVSSVKGLTEGEQVEAKLNDGKIILQVLNIEVRDG